MTLNSKIEIHVTGIALPVALKSKMLQTSVINTDPVESKALSPGIFFRPNRIEAATKRGSSKMIQARVFTSCILKNDYPFIEVTSETSVVSRERKSATIIARPTATSAAATVMIKKRST